MNQDELERLITEYLGPTAHLPIQWQAFLEAMKKTVTSGAVSNSTDLVGLGILSDLSSEVSVTSDLNALLTRAALNLSTYLDATSVYICNWDFATGNSQVLAEHITKNVALHEAEQSVGYQYNLRSNFPEIDTWLQSAKEPYAIYPESAKISASLKTYYLDNEVKGALYLPILLENRTYGYVEIYNSRESVQFTEAQYVFAMAIANMVASAIHNRNLYNSLQASEHRFRGLVENTNELITVLDENGTVEYVSPTVTMMLGFPDNELIGKNLFALVHEEDREDVIREMQAARDNPGTTFISNFRIHHQNRTWVHLEATGNMATDEGGVARNYISARDITMREQHTEREREQYQRRGRQTEFINRIANQIGTIQRSSELYQMVVTALQRDLDIHYHLVQFFKFAPASNEFVIAAVAGEKAVQVKQSGLAFALGDGTVGKSASRMKSVLVPNTYRAVEWKPNPGFDNTRSELATPVRIGNNLIGVLNIQSTEIEDIDTDVQLLLEVLAGLVAVASESIRLRQEMQEQMEELNTLQRRGSQAGLRQTSSPLPATIGYDPLHEREELVSRPVRTAATGGLVKPMEVRGERIGAIAIEADPDDPLTAEEQSLLDEITAEVSEALERARLFEASQRSAAELTVLNEMGNAFTENLKEDAIIENIFKFTKRLMDIDDFYVALYDDKERIVSFSLVEINNQRVNPAHELWDSFQPRPLKTGLTGYVIENRQPVLIENNAEEVLTRLGLPYVQIGEMTQSWLGVPMTIGERPLGMINVQSDERTGLYNERHLGLLTSIASQAAIAIDNARLLEGEQKRAEQERLVRTITDRVRRGADMQSILRIALEEVGQALGAEVSVAQLGTRDELIKAKQQPLKPAPATNGNAAFEEETFDIAPLDDNAEGTHPLDEED
jgi:PAS domain S-box-containing protein